MKTYTKLLISFDIYIIHKKYFPVYMNKITLVISISNNYKIKKARGDAQIIIILNPFGTIVTWPDKSYQYDRCGDSTRKFFLNTHKILTKLRK